MLKICLSHCVLHVIIILSSNLNLFNYLLNILKRPPHVRAHILLIHLHVLNIRFSLNLFTYYVYHLILELVLKMQTLNLSLHLLRPLPTADDAAATSTLLHLALKYSHDLSELAGLLLEAQVHGLALELLPLELDYGADDLEVAAVSPAQPEGLLEKPVARVELAHLVGALGALDVEDGADVGEVGVALEGGGEVAGELEGVEVEEEEAGGEDVVPDTKLVKGGGGESGDPVGEGREDVGEELGFG